MNRFQLSSMIVIFVFGFSIVANPVFAQDDTRSQESSEQDETTDNSDRKFSGPQVGEKMPSIKLENVHGQNAGKEYELNFDGKKAGVLIFVHERTRIAFSLARAVMGLVVDHSDDVSGTICFLSNDPPEARQWLNQINRYFPKGVDVSISVDGVEGPGAMGLNRNVMMTVLVAKNGKVDANFALAQPSLNADGQKIADAIGKSAGMSESPKIAKYAPQMRGEGRNMRGRNMRGNNRGNNQQAQTETLRPYLAPVIRKNASEEDVVKAAEKLEKFLADNPEMKKTVGAITNRIINAGVLENYGTAKAQEYLKKWAKEYGDK